MDRHKLRESRLKETVSQDFLPLVFFVKHLPLGHCFTPLSVFANNFEFTEIFELKVDSAVSMTPLSHGARSYSKIDFH
jgi:hypothetical protein